MEIDCVFSGGGIKAFAYIGTLQSLQAKEIRIKRVAGTSAGAILAALVTAGYDGDDIQSILTELDLKQLLDPPLFSKYVPFGKWLSLSTKMGLYKGNKFKRWIEELLIAKGIDTFADVEPGHLKIVISDISLGKLVVLPDDLERVYGMNRNHFSVAKAIRMSASFPYFFMPQKLVNKQYGYSYIVDGGILSNFPLWIFNQNARPKRPVLGATLSDSIENTQPMRIKYTHDLLKGMFLTMMRAHDTRYVSKKKQDDVIFIPVKDIPTMDFSITEEEKNQLIELGRDVTTAFLHSWPR